jgi:hypothetical protein
LIFERLLGRVRDANDLANVTPSLILVQIDRKRQRDFAAEGLIER